MRASFVILAGLLSVGIPPTDPDRQAGSPELPQTVAVSSGALRLTALVWKPAGPGPFPAVLFNHGSGPTDPARARILGPLFARHGYVFLYLFRRGDGLSADQGTFMGDLLDRELRTRGEESRNRLQLRLLTTDHLDDVRAGLSFLKSMPGVDARRIAVAGHSFGAQLAILAAEEDSSLRAAVCFAPAAVSWGKSRELRSLLLAAVGRTRVPVLLIYAANDFSTAPGEALAAELQKWRKAGELKIYPAVGRTADEGHNAVYLGTDLWEDDVSRSLGRYVQ